MRMNVDKIVTSDYSIAYFHHGLSSKVLIHILEILFIFRTSQRFLGSATCMDSLIESENDISQTHPSYKKNLKALYVIHPTTFIKMCLKFFQPFIRFFADYLMCAYNDSSKFGKKITFISELKDLYEFVDRSQLNIPSSVIQ
jgi:hypothetical protein